MGSTNKGGKDFQMAQNAQRYRYRLVWYQYHFATIAIITMGTGTIYVVSVPLWYCINFQPWYWHHFAKILEFTTFWISLYTHFLHCFKFPPCPPPPPPNYLVLAQLYTKLPRHLHTYFGTILTQSDQES